MKLLKRIVSKQKEVKCKNSSGDRDIYMFVPEDGVFKVYITDNAGIFWQTVTRWTLTGFEKFNSEGIKALKVRPFSITAVCSEKTAELRYILTNILYDRKPLGRNGTHRALCEPFDSETKGSISVWGSDIPLESILSAAFVLNESPEGRSVSPLCKKDIEMIMSALSENNK